MEPCIVFIESNTSGTGKQFVSAARSLGLQPVLFAEDPSRYSYAQQEAVQIVQHSCVDNLDGLERSIARLAGERKLTGIYSSSEYFIETAAQLAQHFGLPGPAPAAVRIWRRTHSPVTFGDQLAQEFSEPATGVKQVVGPIAPKPLLEQPAMIGVLAHVLERHLMGPEGALDRHAVHFPGSGPSLGRAKHDHGPGRPRMESVTPSLLLNAADLLIARVQRARK